MANDLVKSYSADQVNISFAGLPIDSGFADGEFVTIKMKKPIFMLKTGADGEGARARSNDYSSEIKIKLLQTSQGNNLLMGLYKLAKTSQNGEDAGAFQVIDGSSGITIAHATLAWIAATPDAGRGRDVGEVEWTLEANSMEIDVSGNPAITGGG